MYSFLYTKVPVNIALAEAPDLNLQRKIFHWKRLAVRCSQGKTTHITIKGQTITPGVDKKICHL